MPDPLNTITFALTRADALAYERWAARPTRMGTVLFVIWLTFAGGLLWILPDNWTGTFRDPGFWALGAVMLAIFYVLAMLPLAVRDIRRARRRLPQPHDVTIEEYPDRLDISGLGIPRALLFAGAAAPVVTPTHLFHGEGDDLLILPRHAFPEEGSFDALVARFAPQVEPDPPPPAVDHTPAEGLSPPP